LQTRQQMQNMQEVHKIRELIWKEQLGAMKSKQVEKYAEENVTLKQEVETFKTLLEAAELAIKKDDEEWRQDFNTLRKEKDSLKEQNDTLTEEISTLKQADTSSKQEIESLKEQLEAAELALKKDDEEWRQDYETVTKEKDALKEENDSLTEEINELKDENETLKQDKQTILDSQKEQLDAAVVAQKNEDSEWRLECDSLNEKIVSMKQENEKLLQQQLDAALIGRRTSIEELESLKTSSEDITQQYEVLKVATEEAEKEIVLLQNDKSTLIEKHTSLEKQLKSKESHIEELLEAAKNKNELPGLVTVNQFPSQKLIPSQIQKELDNVKLQLIKTKAENEQMRNETNALQRELHSTVDQLSLQKRLHQQDNELLEMKFQKKEDEWNIVVSKYKEEINLLQQQQQQQDFKRSEGVFNYVDQSIDITESLGPQRFVVVNNSPVSQQTTVPPSPKTTDQVIQSELVETSEIPKASTSLNFPSSFHSQPCPTSSSMPSLQSNSGTVYSRRTVITAHGEVRVMCKQFNDTSDLQCGIRMIVHRSDRFEYATVQAFPVGASHLVGIELDLQS